MKEAFIIKTIVGKKAVTSNIIIIAVNIALDIAIFASQGATWFFFVCLAITGVLIIQAIVELSKKIEVDERGVVLNNVVLGYHDISHITSGKNKIMITTKDGKQHKVPITNELEVIDVINSNGRELLSAQAGADSQAAPYLQQQD